MNAQWKFSKNGACSESEIKRLNAAGTPIIYLSNSSSNNSSYCLKTSEILNSSENISEKLFSFSNENKSVLGKLNAILSIGITDKKYRYAHIYTPTAKTLDGIERICYFYQKDYNDEYFFVREFSPKTRGSKYSSLWGILKNRLISNNFSYDGTDFKINTKNNGEKFAETVNTLIDDFSNNIFTPVLDNKIDIITLKQNGIKNIFYYSTFKYIENIDSLKKIIDLINNEISISNDEKFLKSLLDFLDKSKLKIQKKLDYLEL